MEEEGWSAHLWLGGKFDVPRASGGRTLIVLAALERGGEGGQDMVCGCIGALSVTTRVSRILGYSAPSLADNGRGSL